MIDTIFTSMDKEYFKVDFNSRDKMIEAVEWFQKNPGQGDYALGGRTIFFENSADAMMCTLKWLT